MGVGIKEFEVTSERTRRLALLTLVIDALESFAGGFGCRGLRYSIIGGEVKICYSECDEEVDQGYELEDAVNAGLIESYSIERCSEGAKFSKIYEEAADLLIKVSTSYLSSYVVRTQLTGTEYMFIVLRDGRAILLEGERNKVIVPRIKYIASAHTHPEWCIPSPHDVRSWINQFLDGGLGAGIVAPKCRFFIIKSGPFTEDDYVEISRFRVKLSSRDTEGINEVIRNGRIGSNLRVYLIT
ncbi:MAG: hypothetical protein J7L55_04600 [Desulfurococcales archaeon]|nr:hypothetical protein [Desulfurococcales archaeon]